MPNDVVVGLCLALGTVLLEAAIPMIIPGSRRMGLLLTLVAAFVMSAPVTGPLAASFIKSGALSLNKNDVAGILHVPLPWIFFPILGLSAASMAFGSEYLKNRGLRYRVYRTMNDIQSFRLASEARRPVLIRHPTTGKINRYQAQAMLDYQNREHFGYLSKFRLSLYDLVKEIAAHRLGTENDLVAELIGTKNISSAERRLLTLAEQIGQPRRMISRHAIRVALLLVIPPTIIWALWAVVSHANS
jgi:hypothetical protein